MIIKCKKTHRFLCKINIEEYLKNLEGLGVSQELPLILSIPCKNCKKIEVYEIYKDHYLFKENEVSKMKCHGTSKVDTSEISNCIIIKRN